MTCLQCYANIDWDNTFKLVTATAAVTALFLNWLATLNNTKTRQLQVFYQVFKDVQDLQDKYYKGYPTGADDSDDNKIRNWLSIFFDSQECMAFLINKKHLEGDFKDFYKDGFITFYEQIFTVKANPVEREDPKQYPEIKKLYVTLTSPEDDILQKVKEMFNP